MPLSARTFGDIWVGICCCHPPIPCIGMAGPIITGSPNTKSGNLPQARLVDMTIILWTSRRNCIGKCQS